MLRAMRVTLAVLRLIKAKAWLCHTLAVLRLKLDGKHISVD
jgi:hypothetical protein